MKKFLLCFAIAGIGMTASSYAQLTENFEGASVPALPTGWTNIHVGAGNGWETSGSAVTFTNGDQIPAHTKFAVVNDNAHPCNYPAKMTSSTFSLTGTSSVYLVYDVWFPQYHITATGRTEKMWIELSTDGGSTFNIFDTITSTYVSGVGSLWFTRSKPITATASACQIRFVYTDNRIASSTTDTSGLIGCALDNIKIFTPPTNEIALVGVTPVAGDPGGDFATVGGSVTFGGTVFNNGATTVTGFDAGYKVGAGTYVSGAVTGLSIAPFSSGTFTCTAPYNVTALGNQTATVYVRQTGDATFTNDTMQTAVNGVSSFPTKRPFFEEPTGTWCQWCVRGVVYMDSLQKTHKDKVSIVSVHNGSSDPMRNDNLMAQHYDTYASSKIGGFPGLIVDHVFTQGDPSDVFVYYDALSTWYGFADMKLYTSITGGTTINATTKVTPTTNMSGDYRVELIVTEDRVHGTASGYIQKNAYAGGGSGPMQNTEYNFATLPFSIPAAQMNYDFVARYTVPDLASSPNGVASSLPATMNAGTTYSYTFTPVTIGAGWVSNKLHAIALLIDNNPTSYTYNMVLNSANTIWSVGVANTAAGIEGVRVFPNPATEEANVIFDLSSDASVAISVYDAVGRVVYTRNQTMTGGEQQVTIPVADLATGLYNVVIATEKGSISERFSVIK